MKTEEFKNELFLRLQKEQRNTEPLADAVNRVNLVAARLHGDESSLVDLRDGPMGEISLDQAVEKLAFDLENERELYNSYKRKLSNVIYTMADTDDRFAVHDAELMQEFCDDTAEAFLDEFILDVNNFKKED